MIRFLCWTALVVWCSASFVAVDLGTEWTKIALIDKKAPTLLDIAINDQSNRKTPTLIGFEKDGEQVFGETAQSLYYRNPNQAFPSIKRLLGQSRDSTATASWERDLFVGSTQQKVSASARKSVSILVPGQTEPVAVEELVGVMFQGIRQVATNHANVVGVDANLESAVVVVPDFYSQPQRQLITQLAQLGGLKVRTVVGDLSAVAVDYGVRLVKGRAATEPLHVYFYGMGATGVSALLVRYTSVESTDDKGVVSTHLKIERLASSADPTIGGATFDYRIRDRLVQHFDGKAPKGLKSVGTSPRAMAKLTREAREVKEQLSVSPAITVQLEELYESLPFKLDVTREQLESWTADLLASVSQPLAQVIEAGKKLGVKTADVELFGGGSRIPSVVTYFKQQFPTLTFGRHVDGDEAAVLGAGHYLAVLEGVKADAKGHRLITVELSDGSALQPIPTHGAIGDLSAAEVAAATTKLNTWTAKATQRREAAEAKNRLESYVNEVKELISDKKLKKASVQAQLEAAQAFLDSSDASTTQAEFEQRQSELRTAVEAASPAAKKDEYEEVTDAEASRAARRRKADRAYARKAAEKNKAAAGKKPKSKPTDDSDDDDDADEPVKFELPDVASKKKPQSTKPKADPKQKPAKTSKKPRKDDL